MTPVIIGFGSNIGDGRAMFRRATCALAEFGSIVGAAPLYATAPMYVELQDQFLNTVVLLETKLGPRALLDGLKRAESKLGRVERGRNGPREIDLDLITYGALILRAPDVAIPHPRAHERRFVLQPWLDLDPVGELPGFGPIARLLSQPEIATQRVQRAGEPLSVQV